MSEEDKLALSSPDNMFFLYRSNLKFNRLDITTQFVSVFAYRIVILAIELGDKALSIYNSDILYEGAFLLSNQYMSLDYENVNVDMYKSQGGIIINPSCIEHGLPPETLIRFENVNHLFSQGKNLES